MVDFTQKPRYTTEDLIEIVRLLRSPDGCPWDKEQTHKSIRQDFIEEVYEAIEAIDTDDAELLEEELGDVLLQVAMHAQMAAEENKFTYEDIVDGICKKMIIRHPHVFGDTVANDTKTVLKNWDTIKMQTKSQKTTGEAMQSVSKSLPSLMRSEKLLKKASKHNLAFQAEDAFEKAEKAFDAFKQVPNTEQLGALLLTIVNLAGSLHLDCEKSLYYTCDGFTERFMRLEEKAAQEGIDIQNLNQKDLDLLWADENQTKEN